MRLFSIILFVLSAAVLPAKASDYELTNATLIAKLHLDNNPRSGQMVGAYVATIRAKKGTSLNKITVLLNPGLQFVRAEAGRQRLNATDSIKPIQGLDMLELNVVEIDLGRTLSSTGASSGKDRMDIAIHYRGYVEGIGWTGLNGVNETLSPSYTMIRPESFSYPVFAAPTKAAFEAAFNHKPFYQNATIEYPGANTLVSNLKVDTKALNGSKTQAELSTKAPAKLLTVAIGPYSTLTEGVVSVDYLSGQESGARATAQLFNTHFAMMNQKLGQTSSGLKIIQLQNGYQSHFARNALFVSGEFLSSPSISDAVNANLATKWNLNPTGRSDHWANGLDKAIRAALNGETAVAGQAAYDAVSQNAAITAAMKKFPLADFTLEGMGEEGQQVSLLGFLVLADTLGQDQFFALVRSIRASLGSGYADMEALADHLNSAIKNKKARKFAKTWFNSKKAGKELAKSKSFAALVAKYK